MQAHCILDPTLGWIPVWNGKGKQPAPLNYDYKGKGKGPPGYLLPGGQQGTTLWPRLPSQQAQAQLGDKVAAAVANTKRALAAEQNRTKQLKEELLRVKTGKPPRDTAPATPPKVTRNAADSEGFVEVPATEWICFGCKTKHHNMGKTFCRNPECEKPRASLPAPVPVKAPTPTTDLGPANTKEAKKLWNKLGAATLLGALSGGTPEATAEQEAESTAATVEREKQAANLRAQLAFLHTQVPADEEAIQVAKLKLEKLTTPTSTLVAPAPRVCLGKLQLLLDKQLKWQAEQEASEAAKREEAQEAVDLAQAKVHSLQELHHAAATSRAQVLGEVRAQLTEAEGNLAAEDGFMECVDVEEAQGLLADTQGLADLSVMLSSGAFSDHPHAQKIATALVQQQESAPSKRKANDGGDDSVSTGRVRTLETPAAMGKGAWKGSPNAYSPYGRATPDARQGPRQHDPLWCAAAGPPLTPCAAPTSEPSTAAAPG
jgi:hypothetical protein